MNDLMSRSGPVVARVYAALVYVASLALLFAAAVLTGTHAREAFIFVFLPGVLLAVLSRFIWTGSRSAMILAFAVSVALELMVVANAPESWGIVVAAPVVFGMLTAVGLAAGLSTAALPQTNGGAAPRVADEVYAAVVYFTGLLAVFMAPFNHSRQFGLPGAGVYALALGVVLGALSVFIWRGRVSAMIAAFALSLAHWIVLANINPSLWRSLPYLAAPAVSGLLTVVCIAASSRAGRSTAVQSGDEPPAAVEASPELR
jgi:hypothetical protein